MYALGLLVVIYAVSLFLDLEHLTIFHKDVYSREWFKLYSMTLVFLQTYSKVSRQQLGFLTVEPQRHRL